ncbi:MAG: Ger(x)C family spore germination protein [Oscillospiraceae bacterium]|jgi:spore germination protein KC|nr:Ger(x)C family spore germination protein [Oscillospiraceae bacterium]
MITKGKRIVALLLIFMMLPGLLSGCWDSREIDKLFIVTGIAIDATDDPDQVDVTMQIGKERKGEAGLGEAQTGGSSTIVLNTVNDTIMGAIREFNRNSNRKLLLQHNPIRLFGIEVAEHGVKKHIDLFLRDQQARLEVPVAIVEGRAADVLTGTLDQDPLSGMFVAGLLEDLSKVSVELQVRMLDFVSRLLQETVAPMMPIIAVVGEEDKKEIKTVGMGIFKGDKLVGRLDNDQSLGYIWAMGDVSQFNVKVQEGIDKAILHVSKLKTKREVTISDDGVVKVKLSMEGGASIAEMEGFGNMTPQNLIPHLKDLAQEEMKQTVTEAFQISQGLNADMLAISATLEQRHPKKWEKIKDRWDEIYPTIELTVDANLKILGTGQIIQSLEMEEAMK